MMRQFSITQLPVVNENETLVGIIHLHDLIKEGFC
ncbi:MAG TPA: CBS domain-containing protein [Saprospiraceae bacterium]|nr:CBS domain-containing protein [Saprospiraceae bacterium]